MTMLTWDQSGEKVYETGTDRGVLYIPTAGTYDNGFAWNGLVSVTETPSGGEVTKTYADNIVYASLVSLEEFGGTIEAYTYPDEFAECDGTAEPETGVFVGQQARQVFGFSFRSLMGNDVDGTDFGYKLHLVYGATASPSEKAYNTVNDSPEAITFSWEFTTVPVPATGLKPTSLLVIDSTKADPAGLAALEAALYGDGGGDAHLPLPDEVIGLLAGSLTEVDMGTAANQPTYVSGTHVITLPAVTGVQWKINGVNKSSGAQPALTVGQVAEVTAHPLATYTLVGDTDWTFNY